MIAEKPPVLPEAFSRAEVKLRNSYGRDGTAVGAARRPEPQQPLQMLFTV
ncbi:MAG: hypothetical protein JOZ74_01115 [Bradyrhizobium sp.]|nr:hypothetical protein [Bradyrhizobium sp.]